MLVMPSGHLSWRIHYLQGRYGGLGILLGPGHVAGPYPDLPYVLDNGAYSAWQTGEPWKEEKFLEALEWAKEASYDPLWVVAPDVVTDAEATFEQWRKWEPRMREQYDFPIALAVQDGMTPERVRDEGIEPDVVFVGGTRDFKFGNLRGWTSAYENVHVGRINGLRDLMRCHHAGVSSIDGSGWFRGRRAQLYEMIEYLRECGEGLVDYPMFEPTAEERLPSLFDGVK